MLHMRRRSSIRTSRAEVEHAPETQPLALSPSSSQAPPPPPPPQQQQQRHCALLFGPNTDTGPEAGIQFAQRVALTPDQLILPLHQKKVLLDCR